MFEPHPNQLIVIDNQEYLFDEHPNAPGIAYGQEGRKAIVYRVKRKADGELFALKIFKPKFRGNELRENSQFSEKLGQITGLRVCRREYLKTENNPDIINSFPDLNYAVIMPWIKGQTWQDIILQRSKITVEDSLILARKLLELLSFLEKNGYAHCDISNANLIIDCEINANNDVIFLGSPKIELIDVEDMYGPNFPDPADYPKGSAGYHHKEGRTHPQGQWRETGDRFSSAVLLAEMLTLHDENVRNLADKESFFEEKEIQNPDTPRYKALIGVLSEKSPEIANLFQRAWVSEKLEQCPSISEWEKTLSRSENTLIHLQTKLKLAIKNNLDLEIAQLVEEIKKINYSLSKAEWIAYLNARHNIKQKERTSQIFQNGSDIEILSNLDANTSNPADLSKQRSIDDVKRHVQKWILIKLAINNHDDKTIVELYEPDLFDRSPLFTNDEVKAIEDAQQRYNLALTIRFALKTQNPIQIIQSYPVDVLIKSTLLTFTERQKLSQAYLDLDVQQLKNTFQTSANVNIKTSIPDDELQILELWNMGKIQYHTLSNNDREKFKHVVTLYGRVIRIQRALQQKKRERVEKLLKNKSILKSKLMSKDLRLQIKKFYLIPSQVG